MRSYDKGFYGINIFSLIFYFKFLLLILFYFFFTNLIWSEFFQSPPINYVYISVCCKHRKYFSFLFWIQTLLVDSIHYFFRYLNFMFLCCFLYVSLLYRIINKPFRMLSIKYREDILEVITWRNITFFLLRDQYWLDILQFEHLFLM